MRLPVTVVQESLGHLRNGITVLIAISIITFVPDVQTMKRNAVFVESL